MGGRLLATSVAMAGNRRFWLEILVIGSGIACILALVVATLGAAASSLDGAAAREEAPPVTVTAADQNGADQSDMAAQSRQAAAESATRPVETIEGMLTCSRCGAKHSSALGRSAADCVRICAHAGASFVLLDGDKVYRLEGDEEALKNVASQRVRVSGVIEGSTIRVTSVEAPD